MSLNSINSSINTNTSDLSKIGSASQEAKTQAAEKKAAENSALRVDKFVKSEETSDTSGIYSRESIVEQLKADEKQRVSALREMIMKLIGEQGSAASDAIDSEALEELRAKAKASISEGGEYSVENVTDRIMKMAKALSGGDPSKIDMLQDAVIKGFEKAAGVMGKKSLDEMPEITRKTYASVMNQFAEWKKSYTSPDAGGQDASAAQTVVSKTV